jgi:hypothetical protein
MSVFDALLVVSIPIMHLLCLYLMHTQQLHMCTMAIHLYNYQLCEISDMYESNFHFFLGCFLDSTTTA